MTTYLDHAAAKLAGSAALARLEAFKDSRRADAQGRVSVSADRLFRCSRIPCQRYPDMVARLTPQGE